jgi:hypothetical protein
MRKLYLLLLLTMPGLLLAQTNYPPNTPPWNNHPTNWVYDCSFTGYGQINPNATNLACGWYDEPTNVIAPATYTRFVAGTNLALINCIVFSGSVFIHGTQIFLDTVTIGFTNYVSGSNYVVYGSTDLINWSEADSFQADDSGSFTFQIAHQNQCFFRIYGAQSQPFTPVTSNAVRFGELAAGFYLGTKLFSVFRR